jgi:hypothetical protein
MKLFLFLLIFIVCSPTIAKPGKDFKSGYVILLSGDTIRGHVMDRDESAFGGLLPKIKFRNEKGRRKKYKPSQLLGYQRGDDLFQRIWIYDEMKFFKQRYISKTGLGEQSFVKVVHRGSLDLYHWEYMDEDNSNIDYVPLFKKADSEEMVRVTQGILGLKRKRLAEYFAGCPDLVTAILTKQLSTAHDIINVYEQKCQP